MKVFSGHFFIQTSRQVELVDVTQEVEQIVGQSDLHEGLVTAYSPHTTTGMVINEAESHLTGDIENSIKEIVSWERDYGHNAVDDNAAAHITATWLGCSAVVPLTQGQLELGRWQSVFLVELDGPRQREIIIKIIGEK